MTEQHDATGRHPRPDDAALRVRNLDKRYSRKIHALRGVDLDVGRGEIFGLLGPNGAGKSTLVKILMTLVRPTRGDAHILGSRPARRSILARVGYLPEHHRFPPYLTGAQVLHHIGRLAGTPRADRRRRAAYLLDRLDLAKWAETRVAKYSKGMRQKIGIAQALINDPELVLLDEPTDGVDPVGRRTIREFVAELRDQRKTVFLNSHLLSELEMVCDRVAILVRGRVVSQGTLDELTAHQRRYDIRLPQDQTPRARDALAPLLAPPPSDDDRPGAWRNTPRLAASGRSVEFDHGADTIRVETTDPVHVQPVLDALRAAGITIAQLRPHRPSLEDLFIQAVQTDADASPQNGKAQA